MGARLLSRSLPPYLGRVMMHISVNGPLSDGVEHAVAPGDHFRVLASTFISRWMYGHDDMTLSSC